MPGGLSIFSFASAIEIIGRAIGKIVNRVYTVVCTENLIRILRVTESAKLAR